MPEIPAHRSHLRIAPAAETAWEDVAPDTSPPAGDRTAGWESAYRENVGWVYGFVYARVGNRNDAEDITADVFTRALPRLRMEAPPPQLRAYLATTARTRIADHWQRHYDVELTWDVAGGDGNGVPEVPGVAAEGRLERLLALLPEHYRKVLELRFLRGCSVRETAHQLGISVANARVLQHRALRRAAQLGVEVTQ